MFRDVISRTGKHPTWLLSLSCELTNSLNLNSPCPGTVPASFCSGTGPVCCVSLLAPVQSPRAWGSSPRVCHLAADLSWPPRYTGRACPGVGFTCWKMLLQHSTRLSVALTTSGHEQLVSDRRGLANCSVTGVRACRHEAGSRQHIAVPREDTEQRTLRSNGAGILCKHSIIVIDVIKAPLPSRRSGAVRSRVHGKVCGGQSWHWCSSILKAAMLPYTETELSVVKPACVQMLLFWKYLVVLFWRAPNKI